MSILNGLGYDPEGMFPVIDKMAGLFQFPDSDEIEYGCFVYKLRK